MIQGIDVSHWQEVIDWKKVSTTIPPVEFAIMKCTQGIYGQDAYYRTNKAGCVANWLAHGVYHFFEPLPDGERQMDNFYKFAGDPNLKVWVLDVEWGDVGLAANLEKAVRRITALSGVTPWIYTNANTWNTWIGTTNPDWAKLCPRWVANPTTALAPLLPKAWDSWDIWQYSWTGQVPGIDGSVDLNRFDGTIEEMLAVFGNGEITDVEPSQELQFEVLADALNVRSGPSVFSAVIGRLVKGDIVTPLNVGGTSAWIEISNGRWAAVQYGSTRWMRVK